ncbi:MAG: hypothetical protein GY928_39105 [Colwellia sp.]|nr:hypothetical protein [Colwellia sp.]
MKMLGGCFVFNGDEHFQSIDSPTFVSSNRINKSNIPSDNKNSKTKK